MRPSTVFLLVLAAARTTSAWMPSPRPTASLLRQYATVESTSSTTSATTASASASASTSDKLEPPYQAAFASARAHLKQAIPESYHDTMLPLLSHFVGEYLKANQVASTQSQPQTSDSIAVASSPQAAAARILQAIGYGLEYGMGSNKFLFDVSHPAMRGLPELENGNMVDFYAFGCDFFRPCMDLQKSPVLGLDHLKQCMAQVDKGENVVFFANHQSEADPQVVSCLLQRAGFSEKASEIVYVAGHKVTTDPLAIPFSMGRNLICIHSKKHINADASTRPEKQRQNLRSMKALLDKFKAGGTILWVAPSGGRDRRDLETGLVPLAPFDSKTIDIFRLYGNKSKVKTHYYTLAMDTYELCPPPDFVAAGVGEERNVRFAPVGIAIGKELQSVGGLEGRHEFCEHAFEQCNADYQAILSAIKEAKAKANQE